MEPEPTKHTPGPWWKPGDEVEARVSAGVWVRAIVAQDAPYIGSRHGFITHGAYVIYPDAKEQWECHGGWQPANCLRARAAIAKVEGR